MSAIANQIHSRYVWEINPIKKQKPIRPTQVYGIRAEYILTAYKNNNVCNANTHEKVHADYAQKSFTSVL